MNPRTVALALLALLTAGAGLVIYAYVVVVRDEQRRPSRGNGLRS